MERENDAPADQRDQHVEQGVIKDIGRWSILQVEAWMCAHAAISMSLSPIAFPAEHLQDIPQDALTQRGLRALFETFKGSSESIAMSN